MKCSEDLVSRSKIADFGLEPLHNFTEKASVDLRAQPVKPNLCEPQRVIDTFVALKDYLDRGASFLIPNRNQITIDVDRMRVAISEVNNCVTPDRNFELIASHFDE